MSLNPRFKWGNVNDVPANLHTFVISCRDPLPDVSVDAVQLLRFDSAAMINVTMMMFLKIVVCSEEKLKGNVWVPR